MSVAVVVVVVVVVIVVWDWSPVLLSCKVGGWDNVLPELADHVVWSRTQRVPTHCSTLWLLHGLSPADANLPRRRRKYPLTYLFLYSSHFRFAIITVHHSTTYVYVTYFCRPSSVVCLSVCLSQSWDLQKQLNRSRCRLGCGREWAQGRNHVLVIRCGSKSPMGMGNFEGKGWPIVKCREYRPCAAAMRPFVKLLWPLVVIVLHRS